MKRGSKLDVVALIVTIVVVAVVSGESERELEPLESQNENGRYLRELPVHARRAARRSDVQLRISTFTTTTTTTSGALRSSTVTTMASPSHRSSASVSATNLVPPSGSPNRQRRMTSPTLPPPPSPLNLVSCSHYTCVWWC